MGSLETSIFQSSFLVNCLVTCYFYSTIEIPSNDQQRLQAHNSILNLTKKYLNPRTPFMLGSGDLRVCDRGIGSRQVG